MKTDLLHGSADAVAECKILGWLTDLAKICFTCARNGIFPPEQRLQFSERAEQLTLLVNFLGKRQFSANTPAFLKSRNDLQQAVSDVAAKLEQLQNSLNVIHAISQILELVDQGLAIAAGLAKI